MTQKTTSKEAQYNAALSVADITRNEVLYPEEFKFLTYTKPHDECDGIAVHLGNMAGGVPFEALGTEWRSVEHLYLCGEFSLEGEKYTEIQKDLLTATSGWACKRFKKTKHRKEIRKDFPTFRDQWMLWCVWTKAQNSKTFCEHLLSIPDDRIIVEVIKHDPIWAAYYDESGNLVGQNGMGKILTICRNCVKNGEEPEIDKAMLNNVGIWILGKRIIF